MLYKPMHIKERRGKERSSPKKEGQEESKEALLGLPKCSKVLDCKAENKGP